MKKHRVICLGVGLCVILFIVYHSDKQEDTHMGVQPSNTKVDDVMKYHSNYSAGHVGEVHHVALLKVHKTGSTSIQNIFIRFGESRKLTFILGKAAGSECNGWSSCISLTDTLRDTNILPPPKGKTYEILCSHVIYNRQQFEHFLPRDTLYIASVRDPVRRLESSIAHFHPFRRVSYSTYAKNPTSFSDPMLNNRIAFEFGLKEDWFPSESRKYLNEKETTNVSLYVQHTVKEFDLILINERLDESLVLMKRLLNWKTRDIIYNKKRVKMHPEFKKEDAQNLRSYLYLDYILYESAVREFELKLSHAGAGFKEEVREFKHLTQLVNNFCSHQVSSEPLAVQETEWSDAFTVNKQYCVKLFRSEGHYMDKIRLRQYGTLDTL